MRSYLPRRSPGRKCEPGVLISCVLSNAFVLENIPAFTVFDILRANPLLGNDMRELATGTDFK